MKYERPTILHVVNTLERGGTERVLLKLLHGFNHERIRHVVVTLRHAGALAQPLPDSVACYALNFRGATRRAGLKLAGLARRYHRVLIHARNTGTWFDAWTARLLVPRCRLTLGFHGLSERGTLPPKVKLTAQAASWSGAQFISVSESGKKLLTQQAGLAPHRIHVLRNGVSLTHYDPSSHRQRLEQRHRMGILDHEIVIGSVGSLTPIKGYEALLEAFVHVSQCQSSVRLMLVGDGPDRTKLENLVQEKGLAGRVIFTGCTDEVALHLSCMDLYVCSSFSEGMSNALLEAMASQRTIITTDVGDHKRIIRSGVDGLVIPSSNPETLFHAIIHLIHQPIYRRQLAVSAAQRVKDFDFESTLQAYVRFYQTQLTGSVTTTAQDLVNVFPRRAAAT